MSPDWSANILLKMTPTATGATTYGRSTPIRQKVLARMFWSRTAARSSAVSVWVTPESRKMLKVLRSPVQNCGWPMT